VILAASDDVARVLIELGLVVSALALLARLASRFAFSPIPLYLVAGLAVGRGGVVQLDFSEDFIRIGGDIGVVLLLLALGLEYSPADLRTGLRTGWRAGVFDAVANFTPGMLCGLLLGWDWRAGVLLGGATYISSSGVIAKVLSDLGRLGNRETPAILSTLVMEDLAMAAYLPVVAVLVSGSGVAAGAAAVVVAIAAVGLALFLALRHGAFLSRVLFSRSDEVLLLSVLGATLVVAGVAERVQVSAAIGAFLVGVALSGPVSERASALVGPLRDLFAATFFLFFGLRIDPKSLPAAAVVAVGLGLVTAITKVATGWRAAALVGTGPRGRMRAGTALIARGEFSIVIAGIGVSAGVEPDLGIVAAAYVLFTAITGPILTRYADALVPPQVRSSGRSS
jgi:CPA2 family monovalent cation:H+ antiporter-2